jgi:hypothetical protein
MVLRGISHLLCEFARAARAFVEVSQDFDPDAVGYGVGNSVLDAPLAKFLDCFF